MDTQQRIASDRTEHTDDNRKRFRDKRYGIKDYLHIGTWNVPGLTNKLQELQENLKKRKIDIALMTETKKKLKGTQDLEKYTLIHSGVRQDTRAAAGVAIMINEKWKGKIKSYELTDERIMNIRCRIERGYLTIVCIYAPEEGKRDESEAFYDKLQQYINRINKNDYIIIGGDFNARIGREKFENIIGTNGENCLNQNGKMLRDFACYNNLRIMNSFFKHKPAHTYTWEARGQKSIIDYFLANEKTATLFNDTRVYRGTNVHTDHYFLEAKVRILAKWVKNKKLTILEQKWKVELLQEESVKTLYQKRLTEHSSRYPETNNVDEEWKNIKNILEKAAAEALGKQKKKYNNKKIIPWSEEQQKAVEDKNKAYHKWLQNRTERNKLEYNRMTQTVKDLNRQAQQNRWDTFISKIENDVHGRQQMAYKIMKHLNSEEKDTAQINIITTTEWLKYYKNLWYLEELAEEDQEYENEKIEIDPLDTEELNNALQCAKNRKAAGPDGINNELIKYASEEVKSRYLRLLNICWRSCSIPQEWKTAMIKPIFKKGDRSKCDNYRGISLLNTAYKIYTKILTKRLQNIIDSVILQEQTGFRKGRSCTDNIFIAKQIIEKHREFNRETHMMFVDYMKAFDNIYRKKLWEIMNRRGIPMHLIQVIRNIYTNTEIIMHDDRNNSEITNLGLRQGCSLSPILFNVYIDDAVRQWINSIETYTHNLNKTKYVATFLFADDQLIVADSENSLQIASFKLQQIMEKYNLKISTNKTKIMAFCGNEPIRSKIVLNEKPIEQVNCFKFLGCSVSYMGEVDIQQKIEKFNYYNGTIKRTLKNKVQTETMLKFYKVAAVPSLTYGSECWTTTKNNERRITTSEMRFLRSTAGYSLRDRKRNEDIREELKIFNITDKIKDYRQQWKEHLERMEHDRLPKIYYRYRAKGRRSLGRPKKRWKEQI